MTPSDDAKHTRSRNAPPAPDNTSDHTPSDESDRATDPGSTRLPVQAPLSSRATLPQPTGASPQDPHGVAHVPGYEILGLLGRGGMGAVYKARHLELNRVVALKMMLGGAPSSRGELIRFLAEAEAVAAVRHENVVQVYDYGGADQRPFMALEFCPGGTLERVLPKDREQVADPDEVVALLAKVARGVAAAHALGIVHRDLKPGNVLLAEDGSPKVADFGLAKRGDSGDVTRTGQVMGTPAYMSPEQAKGETKFVGPQADVWALCVMLYEALTGTRPFTGTVQEVLAKVQNADPVPPRQIAPAVSRDLELICLTCLVKQPHERYATAKELADDLDRYERNEPISVRPAGALERGYRWARRKPAVAALYAATAFGLLLVTVAAGFAVLWRDAVGARANLDAEKKLTEVARDDADAQRAVAEAQRSTAVAALGNEAAANRALTGKREELARANEQLARLNYGRSIQIAYQAWKNNKVAEALNILADTRIDLRGWEFDHIHRLCHASAVTFDRHRPATILHAAWSPDGTKLLTAGTDNMARVWDTTGKQLAEIKGHTNAITSAAFGADGSKVVTANMERVLVSDVATGQSLELQGHTNRINSTAVGATGAMAITASADGTARVWDVATGKPLVTFSGHKGEVRFAALSPDGSKAASRGADRTVRVWDVRTGDQLAEFPDSAEVSSALSFAPDGSKLLTVNGAVVRVRDVAGKLLAELKGHAGPVSSAAFGPTGAKGLTASAIDGTARVWDLATVQALVLKGHTDRLTSVAFSRDGLKVVTTGTDTTARVWDAISGAPFHELKGHTDWVMTAAFDPTGSRVVTASKDGTARIWNVGRPPAAPEMKPGMFASDFGPNGRRVVMTGGPVAWVGDANNNQLAELKGHTRAVAAAAWSRDGAKIVTVSDDGTARVWDPTNGQQLALFKAPFDRNATAALDATGGRVVAVCRDTTVRVWDVATGAEVVLGKPREGRAQFRVASFSPDGSRIVGAGGDGTARVWNTATGEQLLELRGHTDQVTAASFSPNGTRVLTASLDRTMRVWDAASGAELLAVPGGPFVVSSSDGARVFTGDTHVNALVFDGPANR